MGGLISGHHHVTGAPPVPWWPFVDNVQVPIVPKLPQRAAKTDLLGLLRLWQQPGGTQILPVIRQLYLLPLHNLLLEDPQLITDGVPSGGDLQRGHGIQIAGSQPPQASVAKAGVRL